MANNFFRATLWSMAQRYLPSVIQIISTLIITRMILPSDFGEVALVTSFNQIASLFVAAGFGEALMYRVRNTNEEYSSVFYFNLLIAFALYALLFLCSPIIARFYHIPRLELLTKVICINTLLYSLSYIQRVLFQKELQFKPLAAISLVAAIVGSTVGIAMAFKGMGVWSIVVLTLAINATETFLLWIRSKWHPAIWLSFSEVRALFPYSIKIFLNNCVQVIYDNIYSLVIGKSLGSKPLGYFNRMQTVVYFTTTNYMYSIESAFFPLLCKNKEDDDLVKLSYEKLLRISFATASFILLILILFAKQIVVLVLTDTWIEGVPVLREISIGFLFVPISYINNAFLKIHNKPQVLLYSNLIKKGVGLIVLIVTISFGDLHIICLGLILYYFVDALISSVCIKRHLNYGLMFQLKCIMNSTVIGLFSSIVALIVSGQFTSIFFSLFLGIIVMASSFFTLNFLFKTKEMALFKDVLLGLKNK